LTSWSVSAAAAWKLVCARNWSAIVPCRASASAVSWNAVWIVFS